MLRVNRRDGDAGLQVVEDPQEAVQRFGRVEADDDRLTELLAGLPPDQLRRVSKLSRQAAKRQRRTRRDNGGRSRPTPSSTVRRSTRIGD